MEKSPGSQRSPHRIASTWYGCFSVASWNCACDFGGGGSDGERRDFSTPPITWPRRLWYASSVGGVGTTAGSPPKISADTNGTVEDDDASSDVDAGVATDLSGNPVAGAGSGACVLARFGARFDPSPRSFRRRSSPPRRSRDHRSRRSFVLGDRSSPRLRPPPAPRPGRRSLAKSSRRRLFFHPLLLLLLRERARRARERLRRGVLRRLLPFVLGVSYRREVHLPRAAFFFFYGRDAVLARDDGSAPRRPPCSRRRRRGGR